MSHARNMGRHNGAELRERLGLERGAAPRGRANLPVSHARNRGRYDGAELRVWLGGSLALPGVKNGLARGVL